MVWEREGTGHFPTCIYPPSAAGIILHLLEAPGHGTWAGLGLCSNLLVDGPSLWLFSLHPVTSVSDNAVAYRGNGP